LARQLNRIPECDRDALPSGAYTFACRKAYRLAYRSQRETPRDRALSGAFALRRKLGAARDGFAEAARKREAAEAAGRKAAK
jgi:hypothetical protein